MHPFLVAYVHISKVVLLPDHAGMRRAVLLVLM
jgi:hypothetical protein